MDECVDFLEEARVCFLSSASSEYWEIKMDENNFIERAFVAFNELFQYSRMHYWAEHCSSNVSKRHGRITGFCKTTIYFFLHRLNCYNFYVARRTTTTYRRCSQATKQRWNSDKVEEMLSF